jgi:DNA-binding response OmpR family regulator
MCKVLVIDDEHMILSLVKQALQQMNYSVETASDGQAGMAKFDAGSYDLVITDIRMPEADGHHVLRHIRKSNGRRTPVVGMSGTPWKLSDHPFDEVLAKPFAIDQLKKTAQTLTAKTC